MIDSKQKTLIQNTLSKLAQERSIKILFACESGSRAWGFPSKDSDYDVRFIYCHNLNHYLSISDRKDSIELGITDDLDIAGWDIRKSLSLLARSNPTLFDWLQSPIVYHEENQFKQDFWQLAQPYFSAQKVAYHHLGLVRKWLPEIQLDQPIKLKKLFYILRSLFAAYWVCQQKTIPPMTFSELRDSASESPDLQGAIDKLLHQKSEANESDAGTLPSVVAKFITKTFAELETEVTTLPTVKSDFAKLDQYFAELIISEHPL